MFTPVPGTLSAGALSLAVLAPRPRRGRAGAGAGDIARRPAAGRPAADRDLFIHQYIDCYGQPQAGHWEGRRAAWQQKGKRHHVPQ